ncbi:sugar ABC transporter ATP-binding protein [Sediminibacillus halophilus]|uniref:Ribose transport system ATP-binding protein n=1 Tax=Sediminibacillus halophilus TaxID=482461 RepID=A0A1G9TQ09_9BACI|nr:sugar ABC transporter ATP-binding protein [Sediminibacillus halophilus]SDM49837.1 ribose transport system ATP-binding protein [Sediminibacillus halophilus]
MSSNYVLEMENIDKSFNRVSVLKQAGIRLEKGEIHALLGENGAGKSTLMNILGGIFPADKGTIRVNGEQVEIVDPRTSQQLGISFIHQELNVVADLKVYENLFLGMERRNRFGLLKVEEMCRKTNEVLAELGVKIDPKAYVRQLDASYKQLIEIARALLQDSKIIIMDEPTTALTEHEVYRLFSLMKNLKAAKVSIIYISHKLKEIQEICDRYTVLRDGKVVGSGRMADQNLDAITKLMVGRSVSEERFIQQHEPGRKMLSVTGLTSPGLFRDINFTLHSGEILGFTGLAGDGRTELFESIFGFKKKPFGSIEVEGRSASINHPVQALQAGIGFVPKDRKENAIIKDLSVYHNMSISALSHFEQFGFLQPNLEKSRFHHFKETLNIKVHDPRVTIDKLSGGNQQKVVLAKWLEVDTPILVFDNPTQGIDIGAKREIYQMIVRLAEQGKAIIILSSEAPEILKVCHTIHVMYQGEITAKLKRDQATEDEIMKYATGSKREVEHIG